MSGVITAVAGATLVGGIISGSMQADASEDAANIQAGASNQANQLQYQMFQEQQQLMQPWVQSGQQNLARLNYAMYGQPPSANQMQTTGAPRYIPEGAAQGPRSGRPVREVSQFNEQNMGVAPSVRRAHLSRRLRVARVDDVLTGILTVLSCVLSNLLRPCRGRHPDQHIVFVLPSTDRVLLRRGEGKGVVLRVELPHILRQLVRHRTGAVHPARRALGHQSVL